MAVENTDAICAKGDAVYSNNKWTCAGCGKTFARSPNQHIYAARKRLAKALESLRTFALKHNEIQFAHMCTAALAGEEWARGRLGLDWGGGLTDTNWGGATLLAIRTTDTTRPDGTIAKSIEAP